MADSFRERLEARKAYGNFGGFFGFGRLTRAVKDNFDYNIRKSYFSDGSQAAAEDEEDKKKGRRGSLFGNLNGSLFGN